MIVCVTGGKGGPGATVLAANLALAWSRTQRSCLLVDLDPFGGDVGAYLDPALLDPRKGLLPLLKLERNGVSPEALKREVQQVTPGLNVLLGSLRPACDLLSGRMSEVLRSAHRIADVVVADLGRMAPESPSLPGLHAADHILVVARPDLQGALAVERALSLMEHQGSVGVVATRVRRRRMADVTELSQALGRPLAATFPELREAAAVSSRRRARRALAVLVETLGSKQSTAEQPLATVQGMAAS
jgi:Mrp family chromosome partitioning ATPase